MEMEPCCQEALGMFRFPVPRKDWRGVARNVGQEEQERQQRANKLKAKHFQHYIEEQIQEAVARGEFDNLPGTGKPLNLEEDALSGDKATAYLMLKHNGYAPPEIELLKEIRRENERIAQQLNRLRRVPPLLPAKNAPITPPSRKLSPDTKRRCAP